jgi:WD40-like Beta Propeller Repeat
MNRRASTSWWVAALVLTIGSLILVACGDGETDAGGNGSTQSTRTDTSAVDGRIAFVRGDPEEGETVTYTVDPDGSDEEQLFFDGPSESPLWAPSGTEIQINCCDDGTVAHFVDPDSGDIVRTLPQPEPKLETFCGGAWSPDGKRIACEAYGVNDPGLNGIYSIRVTDGGGLSRITSNPGGEDIPGDFSPDGTRLVFYRSTDDGPAGIFVINLDGSGLQRVSPPDLQVEPAGAWSPNGSQILLETSATDLHSEIWVVNADGSSAHELPITPDCGGPFSDPNSFGCFDPAWSPDGLHIAFARSTANGEANISIVNADGSGLVQVTDGGFDHQPDWGTPPTAG